MNKIFKRDKRGGPRLWILPVLIMMAISVVSTYGECSDCEDPNPNYDPNNPYSSEPPCNPKPDGTPCGQGFCCYGGVCSPPKCYSLTTRFWPNCIGTDGVPACGNGGTCAPKVECLITHYSEAVLSCSGSQSYTTEILAAKRTTPCYNEWDYQRLLAAATAAGMCAAECYLCAQTGGGLVGDCIACWGCLIGGGIIAANTDMCDFMTDCHTDPNSPPYLSYIATHILVGDSCP